LYFVYPEKNNNAKVEENLLKSIQLDPNNRDYLYAAAYFYKKVGDNDKALSLASALIDRYPNDPVIKDFLLSFGKQ
jgi:Tfp pilus assembly protein PilF